MKVNYTYQKESQKYKEENNGYNLIDFHYYNILNSFFKVISL